MAKVGRPDSSARPRPEQYRDSQWSKTGGMQASGDPGRAAPLQEPTQEGEHVERRSDMKGMERRRVEPMETKHINLDIGSPKGKGEKGLDEPISNPLEAQGKSGTLSPDYQALRPITGHQPNHMRNQPEPLVQVQVPFAAEHAVQDETNRALTAPIATSK